MWPHGLVTYIHMLLVGVSHFLHIRMDEKEKEGCMKTPGWEVERTHGFQTIA